MRMPVLMSAIDGMRHPIQRLAALRLRARSAGSEASLGRRLLSSRCLPVLSFYGSLRTRMPGSWDWFCSVQTSRADDRFFSELDGFELLHARQLKIL